jgi:hypothetical protein
MRAGLACSKRAQSEDRDEPMHGARSLDCRGLRAPVAHRTERSAPDRKAAGSIPARRTFRFAREPRTVSLRFGVRITELTCGKDWTVSDRGRWWSSYFVRSTGIEVELYGQSQSLQASTFQLPPSRAETGKGWRAEATIPSAELMVAAFGATEDATLKALRDEVRKTWIARIQKQRERPLAEADVSGDVHSDEPWLTISWDAEHGCVVAEFKGFCTSEEFRASTTKILDAIRARGAASLVSDNRRLEGVVDEDQRWLSETWVPLAVAAGIERIAVVVAHHGLGKTASENIITRFGKTEFVMRTFASPVDALEWARPPAS